MVAYAGDIEEFNSKQLEFISSVLDKYGFGDAKVRVEPVGKAGDNFTANIKRFMAEKEGKTFKMVVKVAQSNEILRKATDTINMLINEYTMYSEVLPKFTELEIAAGIPINERLRYAEFYGAYMEAPHELILLEDLQEPGFVMLDRFESFDNDTVKLVLKTLARFHSLSFALKDKEPKLFNVFKEKLTNPWVIMTGGEFTKPYYDAIENDAYLMLESERHKNVVKGTISQIQDLFENLSKDDNDSRYTVIQQGDTWTNNILFILNNGKPIQCCMIDYQISKVNSPVSDLHYMIFNCTNYKMRSQYMREWIDFYYSELSRELAKFGLKVNDCFPRTQLDADMKRYAKLSLAFAMIIASVIMRSAEDAIKIKNPNMEYESVEDATEAIRIGNLDTKTKNLFRARVEGTIDTMFDMGYL